MAAMSIFSVWSLAVFAFRIVSAAPPYEPGVYPVPGQTLLYSTDQSKAPPFPGNLTGFIPASGHGPPGADDLLWQNLLSAEWIIYSFYQQGINTFAPEDFVRAEFPNTTWSSLASIRDNEAGHLQLFYESISNNSVKPGPCKYDFGTNSSDPEGFLAAQVLIEIASITFLTGFVQEAVLDASKGALAAVEATETRHEAWSLIEAWGSSPFAGPVDTSFPYAKELLQITTQFIVPGSCPEANPPYPNPSQHLPGMNVAENETTIQPGSKVEFSFTEDPLFEDGCDYWAVFFHAAYNLSAPFDISSNSTTIPKEIEPRGLVVMVISTEPGAESLESVVAGPSLLLYQPEVISLSISKSAA